MRYRASIVSNVNEYLNSFTNENKPKSIANWTLHSVVPALDKLNYLVIWQAPEGTQWIEELLASSLKEI